MKKLNLTAKLVLLFLLCVAVLCFKNFLRSGSSSGQDSFTVTESSQSETLIVSEDSGQPGEVLSELTNDSFSSAEEEPLLAAQEEPLTASLDKDGVYTSKEDVALYIHLYEKLPKNFVTKQQAAELDLKKEGLCIGGDRFRNREKLLPEKKGRFYTECDIDTLGKSSRGAKRIVFSNDGLVYYTSDHYQSFVLLYGEEN